MKKTIKLLVLGILAVSLSQMSTAAGCAPPNNGDTYTACVCASGTSVGFIMTYTGCVYTLENGETCYYSANCDQQGSAADQDGVCYECGTSCINNDCYTDPIQ